MRRTNTIPKVLDEPGKKIGGGGCGLKERVD